MLIPNKNGLGRRAIAILVIYALFALAAFLA